MARGSMSHQRLACLADWGLGEHGWLGSSQISHLRNAKIEKASFRNLEALAAANGLIHCWQTQGPAACLERYGPMGAWGVQEAWPTEAAWVADPDHQGEPLDFEGFCSVFCGRLLLPDVTPGVSQNDAQPMSQALAGIIDAELVRLGLGVRQGMARVMACYPSDNKTRRAMLEGCILGTRDYEADVLEQELYALAHLVSELRELPAGSYGPRELHAELMSSRSRS